MFAALAGLLLADAPAAAPQPTVDSLLSPATPPTAPAPPIANPAAAAPAAPPPAASGFQPAPQTAAPSAATAQTAPPIASIPDEEPQVQGPPPAPEPFSLDAKAYDAALKANAQLAENQQGPLDGGWTLSGAGGERLYRFQFADRGLGLQYAEGAWRDLRGSAKPASSGFVTSIAYDGLNLMLRFEEAGPDDLVVVTLKPAAGGGWSGQLWRAGAVTPASLLRN